MNRLSSMAEARGAWQAAEDEAVGLLIGAGFTFALFLGMAHFEHFGATEPAAEIENVRMAAMPLEPPPPPPKLEEIDQVPEAVLPFSGLEVGASDSPISIAVVPPDLEALIPSTAIPPRTKLQFGMLHTELKPKVDIEADVRRVYQEAEIDEKPRLLVHIAPLIPSDVSGKVSMLRVKLLVLIGQNGKPESVRVMESSGNTRFDAIVVDTAQNEWLFSPGIRRGKKVRVLAQQAFRVIFTSGSSPFSVTP